MKFWAYLDGAASGALSPEELARSPGFARTTLVCPAGGEIEDKNWRRAGEFPDLVQAIDALEAAPPPPAGLSAGRAGAEAMLDETASRIFGHVSSLMAELESRRGEKDLVKALEREASALREELSKARAERDAHEKRAFLVPGLEERLGRVDAELERLRAELTRRDASLAESRAAQDEALSRLAATERRLAELERELAAAKEQSRGLSEALAAKELQLAKAVGLVQRLDDQLAAARPAPEPPPLPSVEPLKSLDVPPLESLPADPNAPEAPPEEASTPLSLLRKVFPGHSS